MSTSILVIIPAGSMATKGLASGRAPGRKNIATRKGTMIGAHKKADPCSGKKALKWCDDLERCFDLSTDHAPQNSPISTIK